MPRWTHVSKHANPAKRTQKSNADNPKRLPALPNELEQNEGTEVLPQVVEKRSMLEESLIKQNQALTEKLKEIEEERQSLLINLREVSKDLDDLRSDNNE